MTQYDSNMIQANRKIINLRGIIYCKF